MQERRPSARGGAEARRLGLTELAKQGGQVGSAVRSVGLWLRFDERIGVRALFRCKDHASAEAVQTLLLKNELAEQEERVGRAGGGGGVMRQSELEFAFAGASGNTLAEELP